MPENRTWSWPPALPVVALALLLEGVACGDDDGPKKKPAPDVSTSGEDGGASATVLDAGVVRDAGRRDAGARDGGGSGDQAALDANNTAADASEAVTEAGASAESGVSPDGGAGAQAPSDDGGAVLEADAASSAGADAGAQADAALPPGCAALVRDDECDRSKRPVVFVHGLLGAGDNFSFPALLFASNGYCPDRIRAIDYDSLTSAAPYDAVKAELDATIAELLLATGAQQVDLIGHAQGASHASTYVRGNAAKIAHYIHIAGDALAADPAEVPTLCLSSAADVPVQCGTRKNVVLPDPDIDHLAVATSPASFREQYTFFNGEAPQFAEVQCGASAILEGRAVTFGDNDIVAGGHVEVYELGERPRERGAPLITFVVPADGRVGPWQATRGVAYEFKLIAPPGDPRPPRRMYLPPFTRSDRLLRFFYASSDERAGSANAQVNYHDDHAVFVVRRRSGAFVVERDRLAIDGFAVLNAQNAARTMTTLGLYLFDASLTGPEDGPGNHRSEGGAVFSGSFVTGSDVYISADPPAFVDVTFDGQRLRVPNWPSASEGMSVVVVD